jgi:hypothetical protein
MVGWDQWISLHLLCRNCTHLKIHRFRPVLRAELVGKYYMMSLRDTCGLKPLFSDDVDKE